VRGEKSEATPVGSPSSKAGFGFVSSTGTFGPCGKARGTEAKSAATGGPTKCPLCGQYHRRNTTQSIDAASKAKAARPPHIFDIDEARLATFESFG